MTNPRFDGISLAPAVRLRGHGACRRILHRLVSVREVHARRAAALHGLILDDAGYAVGAGGRAGIERCETRPAAM